MAGKKARELNMSWGAMQSVMIKCEDFIGNVVPLKGSKAASGMIRFYFSWNINGNSLENRLKERDTIGKDSTVGPSARL